MIGFNYHSNIFYSIILYNLPSRIINRVINPKKIPINRHVITFFNNVASGSESPTTAIIKAIAITSGVASLLGSGKLKNWNILTKNCKMRFQNGTPILKNCRAGYCRCRNSMIRKSTISGKCCA